MRREPQQMSIPMPRFQRGGGILDHTGGTYSHSGVIDYLRFPVSELQLGKFPDSMEFQSWKVNDRLQGEQISPITMIASALKKLLIKHINFRKRVSVEEQGAQNFDQFLCGRQLLT